MTRAELEESWSAMVAGVQAIAGTNHEVLPVPEWLSDVRDDIVLLALSDEDEADAVVASGLVPVEYARGLEARLRPHLERLWGGLSQHQGCMTVLFAYDIVYRVLYGERFLDEGVR